jgi:D-alanyl-D-alanine dipeptidase
MEHDRDDGIVLISDPRVANVPIKENNETFIDLLTESNELIVDRSQAQIDSRSPLFAMMRRTLAQKLLQAQQLLPKDMRLFIKEAYRPLSIQRASFEAYAGQLQQTHTTWTSEEVYQEASTYVAPLAVAPHSTGGAVDLTLINADGTEVDMGTSFNASPFSTQNATYTDTTSISVEAHTYRMLLKEILLSVGLVNYPTEWWHWSYGDRYWAFVTGSPYALYRSIDEQALTNA